MQKQEKETKKPKENKKKHKRKVSIFTIFLWLFLIATMSTITIGSLNKKNAIEVTDNNWNIQLVMYDRSSDTPDQAITDFTWNATNEDETRQLSMQINYACTTGKEYQPGEIIIEIPGLARNNFSEYWRNLEYSSESNYYQLFLERNIAVAADRVDSSVKQYDWSYIYDEEKNIYTFTNNMTIAQNENFEGTIQIAYNLEPTLKIQTDLEYQAVIRENIQAEEIITMKSNICNFHYTSNKMTYNLNMFFETAPKADYTPIEDILDDYYWVGYYFRVKENEDGVLFALDKDSNKIFYHTIFNKWDYSIKEILPEGCVLYDENLNKIEAQEENSYYYLINSGQFDVYYYVGYPKDKYQEGESITNTAEVWGRYEDEEEMQKLGEASKTVKLVNMDFEYKGDLYYISKDYSSGYYLSAIKSEKGSEGYWEISPTAFYTGSKMDVEIGDDLLYIKRENEDITKLEDNEYHFTSVVIPIFYTYNKYSGTEGEKLIGYEWELQVRYKDSDEYISYQTGITGEGKRVRLDEVIFGGYQMVNEYICFDRKDIVGVKVIIKDLDKTLYDHHTTRTSFIVTTNIYTQDCGMGKAIYNFCYLQVYHKDEEGNRTLVNEPTLESYKTPSTLKIAEYDQATYGTYMQRAYRTATISEGSFRLQLLQSC